MAKQKDERTLVKQYFTKRPPGSGYFAGHVHLVPEDMARDFQRSGYCRNVTQTLPKDLPGREDFIAAGIETLDEIRELDDPTSVKGVGDATAKELAEWFAAKAKSKE